MIKERRQKQVELDKDKKVEKVNLLLNKEGKGLSIFIHSELKRRLKSEIK